jgi:drug/metabolite transporter (DMT)-like permease
VVGATLLLSVSRIEGELKLRETARYGAAFAIVVAAIDLISKYGLGSVEPLAFFGLAGIGQGIGAVVGLTYLYQRRPAVLRDNTSYAGLRAIAVRSVMFVAGLTLFYLALASTPVSIASSILATQTALTVLFIWLITRFRGIDTVRLGDVPFTVKFLAALGIMAGVTLISRPEMFMAG